MKQLLQIKASDNVAIALKELSRGERIEFKREKLQILDKIPTGHKVALTDIAEGEEVIRYGYAIGRAGKAIKKGEWVHSHNLVTGLNEKTDYSYHPEEKKERDENLEIPTFSGYRRENGKCGIRNEIWIINTVGCINKQTEKLALKAEKRFKEEIESGNIDGIHTFSHPYGCSQLGEDLENTQKLLAGLVKHPNAAGVLVIGLGCENNQMSNFKEYIGDYNRDRVKFLVLQEVKEGQKKGLGLIEELIDHASKFKIKQIPVSELTIGLKCGGSDSFSGITANPLVGRISDRIIKYGGSSILTEVPEMFGAETILMNRAKDKETFNKVVNLINNFKDYFIKNDQEIYENPSPGNREGGITTLEEKSLGCTEKAGSTEVVDVINYGEQIKKKGLTLLEAPGNDLVSTTALTAAGAQIVLFTTGRGTPFSSPAPTIKIASNSRLAQRKPWWIDFDAGKLLTGKKLADLEEELFGLILKVASGDKLTENEKHDFRDIAIFKTGVTL